MRRFRSLAIFTLFLGYIVVYSCKKEPVISNSIPEPIIQIPEGFPLINFPEGNEYTYARWVLGKKLFYDPILSRQNSLSCASCHLAQNAFSDTIAMSRGDNNASGRSNAPTLTNVVYQPYYTRAGGVPTLEMQILVPVQEHDEFNTSMVDIVAKLKNNPAYVELTKNAYNREIDAFTVTRALANFERSLISGNSSYDQYFFQHKSAAMTESAKRGMTLFNSVRTNCSKCHSGFNFTNYSFENNGIPVNSLDSGRMRLTKNESDRDKYKVPTLRNIELTGPYMHDGSFRSLNEVIGHYNSGGVIHKNKSELIKPMGLSNEEQQDLIAFLKTLTDPTFVNNPIFKK